MTKYICYLIVDIYWIGCLHLVGDGSDFTSYQNAGIAEFLNFPYFFSALLVSWSSDFSSFLGKISLKGF